MNVQSVNKVFDVEPFLGDVEHLQDKSEKRDAAEHHSWHIASQSLEKEAALGAVFADLVFDPSLEPTFPRRLWSFFVIPVEMEPWTFFRFWCYGDLWNRLRG